MARAGETVELALREVTIHSLDIVSWDDTDPDRPIAVLDVTCSAGTYVRALARDLGEIARERRLSRRADPDRIGPVHDRRRRRRSTRSAPPPPRARRA